MKKIWVLTMLPEMFVPFRDYGVVGASLRGERGENLPSLELVSIAEFCDKGFKGVDSTPYGGGAGMVMRADVLENALIKGVLEAGGFESLDQLKVVATGPRGKILTQKSAQDLSEEKRDLVIVCGRYEGIDERFLTKYVEEHWSLGDFVLSGGEIAAMAFIDASVRLMSGSLGNADSLSEESFTSGLLEYPQYTRPVEACGEKVPDVLTSGDHKKINKWRKEAALGLTREYRPDLLENS